MVQNCSCLHGLSAFCLKKIDLFLVSGHQAVTDAVLMELGVLGKLAFIGGPVLMLFAGWRYYRLEKEIGFSGGTLFVIPEIVLFGFILSGALLYVFWSTEVICSVSYSSVS